MSIKPITVSSISTLPSHESANLVAPSHFDTPDPEFEETDSKNTNVRCLLIASIFPPIHGGSAVVYENLCQCMPIGSIRVLTARKNYLDNSVVAGWREHDAAAIYPVSRVDFLRPPILPPPANKLVSIWRLLFQDLPVYMRALLAAARIIKLHDINIVCVGEIGTGSWLAMTLRKLYDVKVIIYVHGEEITTASSGRFSGNKRQEYLLSADKIVAVSAFTCEALTRLMDVKQKSIALIQNGVDTTRFTPGPRSPELIARHDLVGKKIIVTVSRLVRRKGIDQAVRAVQHVLRQRQDVHYLIVGDGDLRPEIDHLIKSGNLQDHITLVGTVSDSELVEYLRLCDVFLMPNRTLENGDTEGFGLVFREANACRKPVIGGRAGGVVEAVKENDSGLLVDGNNVEDIAAAIERILGDDALADRLAAGGLQLARDNDTTSVSRCFVTTCEALLNTSAV